MPFTKSLLVLLTTITAIHAEDWPGWRGPTGMGQSRARDLPVSWDAKTGKNVLWKSPLFESDKIRRDQNQSSPIVSNGRVFVTVSYWPEGVTEKDFPEHHVLCFAADGGKKLWDTKVPPGPWLLKDLRGGYTAPTPAADGKSVYVVFGSAVLAALDFDGNIRWRQEVTPYFFDVAFGASPVLHKDTVLLLCDQLQGKKASSLNAYDAKTGDLRWKAERPEADWAHSTPALAVVGGKTQLLVGAASGPQGLDPDNGKKLWWFKAPSRVGDTVTPILADTLVYCDSGRGGMGVAVDPTGNGDVTATHLKWKLSALPEGFSSPAAVGSLLYRSLNPSIITCRDLKDGKELFRERLEGLDPASSPIATADGRVYFASGGRSYVLKAGPKLEVLSVNELGDPNKASPAIAGDRIYLKGGRSLFCIGTK
jgi:outer membrane protein assembly factor BamB